MVFLSLQGKRPQQNCDGKKRYVYLLQNENDGGFFCTGSSWGFDSVSKKGVKEIITASGKKKLRVVAAVETHVFLFMRS